MIVENCLDKNPVSTVTWNQSIYIDNNQDVTVFFLFFFPSEPRYLGRPPPNSVLGSLISDLVDVSVGTLTVQLRYSGVPS